VSRLDKYVVADVKQSGIYGIIVDESTDLSTEKKLVVYVRFVKHGKAETKLLSNLKVDNGKAEG